MRTAPSLWAGLVAGAAFVLVTLLARVLLRIPTPPELVQDRLLLLMPGPLFAFMLERLLYLGKPLFFVALLLLQLGLASLGGLANARLRRPFALAGVAWLLLALLTAGLTGRGPFADGRVAATTLLACAAYGGVLWLLQKPAAAGAPLSWRRRQLLGGGALLLASALLARRVVEGLLPRSVTGATAASSALPESFAGVALPPGVPPPLTAAEAFYVVSKNLDDPVVDATTWRLEVDGLVDQPLTLAYEALPALPVVEVTRTLECISNEVGGDLMSTGVWAGVRLADLLARVGVQPAATTVQFHSVDGYTETFDLAKALDPDTLLVYQLDGQPLPAKHGFPLRVLSRGTYGMKNPKWLTRISVVATAEPGFWEQQGWDPDSPVQTMSRIDSPAERATLPAGSQTTISGVAFAAERGIQRVEVSTDGGASWAAAELLPSLGPSTWTFWHLAWQPESRGATATLVVRATDGTGQLQTDRRSDPFPSGASGYHTIPVRVA